MLQDLRFTGICLATLCTVLGCKSERSQPESARFFYFDALLLGGTGQVYIYAPVNDPLYPLEIWHKRFSGDYHGSHIYSRMLSPELDVLQTTTESISRSGAALIQMELYPPEPDSLIRVGEPRIGDRDSSFAIRVQINEATTFLFGSPEPVSVAKYQVEYREPGPDSIRVILTRLRRYTGTEEFSLGGKAYPALRYVVEETLETETEGFTTTTWQTVEVYAKGLGLVYYKKDVNPDLVLEYRLKEIVRFEQFCAGR